MLTRRLLAVPGAQLGRAAHHFEDLPKSHVAGRFEGHGGSGPARRMLLPSLLPLLVRRLIAALALERAALTRDQQGGVECDGHRCWHNGGRARGQRTQVLNPKRCPALCARCSMAGPAVPIQGRCRGMPLTGAGAHGRPLG